jgi:ABC-2 type transport system permease protein
MLAALLYLQYHSVKNRTVGRLKRLKQPKYLVGGIVGGLYFYFYFFRYLFRSSGGQGLPLTSLGDNQLLFEALGALVLLTLLVLAWIVPHERAALAFTEAEVAFLFPAPISRRGLIHFKLLRSQVAILFTTFLLVLVTNRLGGRAWIHAAGWWLILSTLNLHLLGSSFARTMLLDRGITNWHRRLGILGPLTLVVAGLIIWIRRTLPALDVDGMNNPAALKDYALQVLSSGPIPWLLLPFRLVVRPYLAASPSAFLQAAGPALALLALHYLWVLRSNVAFEEASVEASKRLAERIASVRAGNWQGTNKNLKGKRAPFILRPLGPPPVALLWKNLISAGQVFTPRLWLVLAVLGTTLALMVGKSPAGAGFSSALAMIVGMLILWSLMLGPQFLRQDFRQDLLLADMLKLLPLPGWQVALGELLAPAVVLTAIQWGLLLVGLVLACQSPIASLGTIGTVGGTVGAGIMLPMLNLITLQIPNAAVLLFPAWFQSSREGAQGIEATGQRIIFMLGQLLVFIVALLPAAGAFVAVFFLTKLFLGLALALPLASVVAALVLAGEAALGLMLLGKLFERFDLSAESGP